MDIFLVCKALGGLKRKMSIFTAYFFFISESLKKIIGLSRWEGSCGFCLFQFLFFPYFLVDVGRIPQNWLMPNYRQPKSTEQKLYEYLFEGYQVSSEIYA